MMIGMTIQYLSNNKPEKGTKRGSRPRRVQWQWSQI
jgi:ribosomal protein L24E